MVKTALCDTEEKVSNLSVIMFEKCTAMASIINADHCGSRHVRWDGSVFQPGVIPIVGIGSQDAAMGMGRIKIRLHVGSNYISTLFPWLYTSRLKHVNVKSMFTMCHQYWRLNNKKNMIPNLALTIVDAATSSPIDLKGTQCKIVGPNLPKRHKCWQWSIFDHDHYPYVFAPLCGQMIVVWGCKIRAKALRTMGNGCDPIN